MRDEWQTIDEFARDGGVATTTVRLYTTKGLLPAPRREGRVGYYGPKHRRRLALVTRLQERGFSLAGIQQLLDAWDAGRDLDWVLGLPPGEEPGGDELDAETFAALFPEQDREMLVQEALDAGAARAAGEGVVLPDAANLRIGLQALRLGVPLQELLHVYRELRADTERLARRFAELVERHIWEPLTADGATAEEREQARRAIADLADLAVGAVSAAMRDAIIGVARETAARHGENIDDLLEARRPPR